jgi:hypothetical protein
MSTQFKTLIGSIFAVAALISISTGAASAQDKGCRKHGIQYNNSRQIVYHLSLIHQVICVANK